MSKISDEINSRLVVAQKEKDEVVVSTLRFLNAAVKNKEIELGHPLTDEEFLAVIIKSAKQRRESIDAFEKAGRSDLADREKAELSILSDYLPKQMNDEEIGKIVDEVLGGLGKISVADTGRVIGQVMAKARGQADGNSVSRIVREKLTAS